MMRFKSMLCLGLLTLGCAMTAPLLGQSAPLEDKQKAVVVFDVRMDLIRTSELAKTLGLEDQIAGAAAQQGADSMDPNSIDRVFGALSAPESMAAAQGAEDGKSPVDFFAKIVFTDAAAATEALEKMKEKGAGSFEQAGKTYYRPPADGDAPQNMVMTQVDEKTLMVGTEDFVFFPDQKVFTDGLLAAWKGAPAKQAIRIAMDLEGMQGLLGEAVAQGKQGGNPMVAGYLDLVDNMKHMSLSIDMSGKNLITLKATGVDSENAEELRSGLDAILGLGKTMGKVQVEGLKQASPDMAVVAEEILKSLKATSEGDEVQVVIPKPAGFDAAISKMIGGQ